MLIWILRGLLLLFAAAIGYVATAVGWMGFVLARETRRLGSVGAGSTFAHDWYVETPWGSVSASPWQLGLASFLILAAAILLGWFACSSRFWSGARGDRP